MRSGLSLGDLRGLVGVHTLLHVLTSTGVHSCARASVHAHIRSLFVKLEPVAAVADLEEEPFEWRTAHPG